MRVLIFCGAGTSVELGVPAMAGMGAEFIDHCRQWDVGPSMVERLIGPDHDIEQLIESLDQICAARASLSLLDRSFDDLGLADKVRAEVEWFVQHVAERIVAGHAQLMWGYTLRAALAHETSFVTTNYDRAIELAANAEGIRLDDGFGLFEGAGEVADWVHFSDDKRPHLVKIHGSTDWYSDANTGSPLKLRHPMPLFGRTRLQLSSEQTLGSALVLPSREKLLTRTPYPRLSQAFLNAADSCDLAVFVGSSLRDPHVRSAVVSASRHARTFVVSPSGATFGVAGATGIAQTASLFLMSTLPHALQTQNPSQFLDAASSQGFGAVSPSVLDDARDALNSELPVGRRCEAIERLDNASVRLDGRLIERLLDSTETRVARFALGLADQSFDRERLLANASTSPHRSNPAFLSDLQIVRPEIGKSSALHSAQQPG